MKAIKGFAVIGAAVGLLGAGAGIAAADSESTGIGEQSPGVVSGNVAQIPVDAPLELCGNTVNGTALLSTAYGNVCLGDG